MYEVSVICECVSLSGYSLQYFVEQEFRGLKGYPMTKLVSKTRTILNVNTVFSSL